MTASAPSTSILLPTSSVAIFSRDPATLDAAKMVMHDWRFARVKIQIQEGDVSSAIRVYQSNSSPEIIIVQAQEITEDLPDQLGELANYCNEGTSAIVIGPVNDVGLYRKLIDMGVSDYLVKPVSGEFFADVIAKSLIEKIGVSDSRLIAFIGAKGGVGASALAQAAAWSFADILGQKTVFLDAAGGWSTAAVGMGFEPSATLQEAVKAAESGNEDNLKRLLFHPSEKLSVLSSSGEVMLEPGVSAPQLEKLLDMLLIRHPTVIADISHAGAQIEKAIIARANQIIVVTTPTLPALRLARSLIEEIRDVRGGKNAKKSDKNDFIELIVNMQGFAGIHEVSRKEIEEVLGMKVSSVIPFSPKIFIGSEASGKKLSQDKEGQNIVENLLVPVIHKNQSGAANDQKAKDSGVTGFLSNILGKKK